MPLTKITVLLTDLPEGDERDDIILRLAEKVTEEFFEFYPVVSWDGDNEVRRDK